MSDDIMRQLGFRPDPMPEDDMVARKARGKPEVKPEPVTYSRDVIIEAIRDYGGDWVNSSYPEDVADAIIEALADKHLHIFKSKGSELPAPPPQRPPVEWDHTTTPG